MTARRWGNVLCVLLLLILIAAVGFFDGPPPRWWQVCLVACFIWTVRDFIRSQRDKEGEDD